MSQDATTTAKVWLTIAKGGGHWTVSEVHVRVPGQPLRAIDSAVSRLLDQQCLDEQPPAAPGLGRRFGVTSSCLIPRGIRWADVLEILGRKPA